MKESRIRAWLRRHPFRPLELVLDNGERIRLASPEVFLGDETLVTLDEAGCLLVVGVDSVSYVRRAPDTGRARTG